jgi:arabinofuranan 3-O-arabinosyltransferase
MAFDAVSLGRSTEPPLERPVELTCIAFSVANAVFLVGSIVLGIWLIDPNGQMIASDFVNVWAAGRQALDGHQTAIYDVALHKAAEVAALEHPFNGEYPWIYPPTFLFAAVLLALLPMIAANIAWVFLTFLVYVAVVRGIVGHRTGILLACAYPGILGNAVVGQNGFVTAALLGGALLFMERRPVLAGCFIGLLSFKPHLGILIPFALIAGGHWRVVGAATVVAAMFALASWGAFGIESWEAFFRSLSAASQTTLDQGRADWAKLQSAFGLVRTLGGGNALAWSIQGTLAAVAALLVCALWRSKASFDTKAAALVIGALFATPYIFIYDLVVLAIPMAFLLRARTQTGNIPGEMLGILVASLLIMSFPLTKVPVGFAAALVVGLLIARRLVLAPAIVPRAVGVQTGPGPNSLCDR